MIYYEFIEFGGRTVKRLCFFLELNNVIHINHSIVTTSFVIDFEMHFNLDFKDLTYIKNWK